MNTVEMLNKKIWAVVGVTTDSSKFGYKIYKKLKNENYEVYGISPKYDHLEGDKLYKQLSEVPVRPEVVNFVVNPGIGIQIIKQCNELGIKSIWLQPGTVSQEILDYAKENNIEVVQSCVLIELA